MANIELRFFVQERDDLRRQLADTKRDFEKQTQILQKCLAVNKKLLVEKVNRLSKKRKIEAFQVTESFTQLVTLIISIDTVWLKDFKYTIWV